MSRKASTKSTRVKRTNPYTLFFSNSEKKAIIRNAKKYTNGNIAAWVRRSSTSVN